MTQNLTPTQAGKAPCNGIEIYYETFGNPENPALLLIMGLDSQCIMWSEILLTPIIEAGYYVIRFDNRDIGLSTWLNDSWSKRKPYTLEDMAQDSIELLDFLKIKQAHIMGVSMGGMIAQRIGISYPERVLTLALIMTTGHSLDLSLAPNFKEKIFRFVLPFLIKNFTIKSKYFMNEVSVANYLKLYRFLAGKRFQFNEDFFRKVFTHTIEVRKGQNPKARFQQFCAVVASGSRLKELHKIKAPTLILHGTTDPLVPHIHAKTYAPLIPQAKILWMEGVGHELPMGILPEILPAFFELFSASQLINNG